MRSTRWCRLFWARTFCVANSVSRRRHALRPTIAIRWWIEVGKSVRPVFRLLLLLLRIVDEAQFLAAFRRISGIRDVDRIRSGVLAFQIHGIFGHVAAGKRHRLGIQ